MLLSSHVYKPNIARRKRILCHKPLECHSKHHHRTAPSYVFSCTTPHSAFLAPRTKIWTHKAAIKEVILYIIIDPGLPYHIGSMSASPISVLSFTFSYVLLLLICWTVLFNFWHCISKCSYSSSAMTFSGKRPFFFSSVFM